MQTQASLGWLGPDKVEIVVTNRSTASRAVGAMLMLDQRRSDADSTSNTLGLPTAGIANAIVPVDTGPGDLAAGIFGIVQVSAADNVRTRLRLQGQCDFVSVGGDVVLATDAQYIPVTASTVVTKSVPVNAAAVAATGATVRKVVFIPLTARTGAGTTDGWFNGITGFGTILVA